MFSSGLETPSPEKNECVWRSILKRHSRERSLAAAKCKVSVSRNGRWFAQALGDGRQTVIIRKGGIAEGRDGFAFRHREFFCSRPFSTSKLNLVRDPVAVSAGVVA